ncbi:MAG TPA: LCP family protein [Virgibacillus sp.]|nr:LCP family protein [Virgibacillus sp.]
MAKKVTKRRLRKRVFIVLIPLIVFLSVLGYATYLYVKADSVLSDSYENDGRKKSELREEMVDPKYDNVSVLIMGVDENDHREDDGPTRTDTLILATLNKDDKSVKMHSIPRDSYVYVPEIGYETKINHAHSNGGTQTTIDTVENLLEIPVDYYVKLNFHAFVDVIDAIDGIEVDVPYEFKESDSMDKRDSIHLQKGHQTVNGEEALALARTRKLDNDIERGKRQLDIIKSVINKSVSVSSVMKIDNIIDAVGENMTTNMTFSEMKSFISYGTSGMDLDVESYTLEGEDYQPSNIYYWQLDEVALEETRDRLKRHLNIINTAESDNKTDEGDEEAEVPVEEPVEEPIEEQEAEEEDTSLPDSYYDYE